MNYPIATHGDCTLARSGDHYAMTGPSGEHRLLVSSTNPDRLAAHWAEFSGQDLGGLMGYRLREARYDFENPRPAVDHKCPPVRPPYGGETQSEYLRRLEQNQRAMMGRTVSTRPGCGWSNFVVVGIARDGWRLQVRRLRSGDGRLNKTIKLVDPTDTHYAHFFAARVPTRPAL